MIIMITLMIATMIMTLLDMMMMMMMMMMIMMMTTLAHGNKQAQLSNRTSPSGRPCHLCLLAWQSQKPARSSLPQAQKPATMTEPAGSRRSPHALQRCLARTAWPVACCTAGTASQSEKIAQLQTSTQTGWGMHLHWDEANKACVPPALPS